MTYGSIFLSNSSVLADDRIDVEHRGAVHFAEELILFFDVRFQFVGQDFPVQQVDDADAGAHVLVDIRGSDAAAGCADLIRPLFADVVEQFVIRHDQMGVVADEQASFDLDVERL